MVSQSTSNTCSGVSSYSAQAELQGLRGRKYISLLFDLVAFTRIFLFPPVVKSFDYIIVLTQAFFVILFIKKKKKTEASHGTHSYQL